MTQNRFTVTQPVMLGIYRAVVPPDPISNSEVKRSIADDSVGFPHVKVGQCQALTSKASSKMRLFLCPLLLASLKLFPTHASSNPTFLS